MTVAVRVNGVGAVGVSIVVVLRGFVVVARSVDAGAAVVVGVDVRIVVGLGLVVVRVNDVVPVVCQCC